MRIVLDSNVIISAALFNGIPEKVVKALLEETTIVISPYIINEVGEVLIRKFGQNPTAVALLQEVLSKTQITYFQPFLNVVADEPDNRILETAVKGKAQYIVTGDKLLLKLGAYQDIEIITVAQCLKLVS